MRHEDRRAFLRAVTAAGIGATIGGASAGELPRVELDRAGVPDAEPISLSATPTVARVTGGGPTEAIGPEPSSILPALTPTPRAEVLRAIEAAPGGAELLNGLGIGRGRSMAQVPGRASGRGAPSQPVTSVSTSPRPMPQASRSTRQGRCHPPTWADHAP